MKKSFYSHGKLLITAEYLVLDSVPALAVPTKKGQWLHIEENDKNTVHWKSLDEDNNTWFETSLIIDHDNITPINSNDNTDSESEITKTLIDILSAAQRLNPYFLAKNKGYDIITKLEFNRHWGLGSSSTLINNIAQWAEVNAFALLDISFGGSGYDIACARHNTPIIYTRNGHNPSIKEVNFDPDFKEQLFFIYLNQKQSSKKAIKRYQSLSLKNFDAAAATSNDITRAILNCKNIEEFTILLHAHEQLIASILKTETIQSSLFPDYKGSIKSLGGWGGDFVLATGSIQEMDYFSSKGYQTIIPFTEMIL